MLDCARLELLANAMWLASGDQLAPNASSRAAVTGCACLPLMSATQTCEVMPWNPNRVKLMWWPSGEAAASKLLVSVGVVLDGTSRRRWVPSARMIQIAHRPSLGAQRVNTIRLPSGV